ncbi:DUF4389 domain-containing protein [Microbulbifer celer]|uniref:DUF4389 domain-containing protein n=1 Tax=Microbulbifer celer TaxID=435905 RepID=A0ABW3U6E6_9GAMM|nr:DUF4389 domain-containing protein [Microbulbifer celer]UFN58270.1 DUF4389 domain-containing protein [Microbulbifer celer]
MSNEELKENLTSPNQWLRLVYMVLFAVLLEIAGFVMLAVVIAQFLFSIFTGGPNDNLRRLGDQIASYIYQTLQFMIYNSEEKPFPFSEWPESDVEDLSDYESAEEIDGEVISDKSESEATVEESAAAEEVAAEAEAPAARSEKPAAKSEKPTAESSTRKDSEKSDDEPVINLGADPEDEDKPKTAQKPKKLADAETEDAGADISGSSDSDKGSDKS